MSFQRFLPAAWLAVQIVGLTACATDDLMAPRTSLRPNATGAPAQAAGAAPAAAGARTLTADLVASYFQDGAARAAAERFALEDWGPARSGFADHLAARRARPLSKVEQARLQLLIAEADTHLNQWSRAAAGFEAAVTHLPLIADYIHYQAARARYFAHDEQAAMAHAGKVAPDSIVGAEAALLIGDVLRGGARWSETAEHYRNYLQARPSGIRRAEARYRLAQALEALGQIEEALTHYRTITIHAPLSQWATESQKRLDALLPARPEPERARLTTLTADEYIARGMAYFDAMRNPLSEADFTAALTAAGVTPAGRCVATYHRAQSVFKARDRQRAAPLFDEALAACRDAGNIDLQVKAAYQAGRSYAFIGQHDTAIARYAHAETVSPDHSFVDDARLRQAEEQASLGNQDAVTVLLSSIPQKYPQGDMRAEALWRLGWRAYLAGRHEEAVGWFQKQIDVAPVELNWWAEGQPQYWQGRCMDRLGRAAEAVTAYRDAVLRYPLSYYSLLALNRLREDHPDAFAVVRQELAQTPPGEDPAAPAFVFQPRPVYQSPGFARALEFLRLGLGSPAEAELRALGLNVPSHRDPITDPDQAEKLWAMVFLYDRAGKHELSHWPTRYNLVDYKRRWPVGHNRERWRIAYPRAFWGLVERHARKQGFPPELLMAIMREESGFSPLLESYANAIGLTQLIMPTARRFAQGTGITVDRQTLRDPESNVTIGARFLGFLWSKWDGYVPLVPPSYNAGETAVTRWLKARGQQAADEWIESIVDDQPRGYSKRVIGSFFTYTYLYTGEIPQIGNTIPRRLIP
jgi:soluble lytic murein transglycosylase